MWSLQLASFIQDVFEVLPLCSMHCLWISFFKFVFLMLAILKSVLTSLQFASCFIFWFWDHKACGILAPTPRIKPAAPAWEGKVFTTGHPGKSLIYRFLEIRESDTFRDGGGVAWRGGMSVAAAGHPAPWA